MAQEGGKDGGANEVIVQRTKKKNQRTLCRPKMKREGNRVGSKGGGLRGNQARER